MGGVTAQVKRLPGVNVAHSPLAHARRLEGPSLVAVLGTAAVSPSLSSALLSEEHLKYRWLRKLPWAGLRNALHPLTGNFKKPVVLYVYFF